MFFPAPLMETKLAATRSLASSNVHARLAAAGASRERPGGRALRVALGRAIVRCRGRQRAPTPYLTATLQRTRHQHRLTELKPLNIILVGLQRSTYFFI